ncbi:MAG: hypothetical protein WBO56_02135 [Microgenomates group bacterium]
MNKSVKLVVGVVIAVLAFTSNPHGPLGFFWRPNSMAPNPTNLQLPFFILLNIVESVTFALTLVLLLFYFPKKALSSLTLKQTRTAFVCLLWILGNWWMHDSLHMHIGMNLQSLLYIEYGFHITMMGSALYLLWVAKQVVKTK